MGRALNWCYDNSLKLWIAAFVAVVCLIGWMSYDYYFPSTATWRNICIDSSQVYVGSVPTYRTDPTSGQQVIDGMSPRYETYCNQYEVQCRPGRDGTRDCSWDPRPRERSPGFI